MGGIKWRLTGCRQHSRRLIPRCLEEKKLPGLHGLCDLADLRPVIVVDSREQTPLVFTRLQAIPGTLYAGDYSVCGLEASFAVERKSIDDLANCCMGANRERFERELHRLRGYRFKRLLVVGTREDIAAWPLPLEDRAKGRPGDSRRV